jgi:hypothetical protein
MRPYPSLLLLLTFLITAGLRAQEVTQVQPSIMVMPFTKEGEDIRTILDNDFNTRLAVTLVKDAFDQRSFTTVDFTAKLKQATNAGIFTSAKSQSDLQTEIIRMSDADLCVLVDAELVKCPGYSQQAHVYRAILTGYLSATASSLANKVLESPCNEADAGALAKRALRLEALEPFMNTLGMKFQNVRAEGLPVYLEVGIAQNATDLSMETEIGSDHLPLKDALRIWLEDNAYKNYVQVGGTSNIKMIVNDVRTPLRHPKTGRNYSPADFSLSLLRHLQTLGLKASREEKGYQLFFTLSRR